MSDRKTSTESDCIRLIGDNFLQRSTAFAQISRLQSTHGGVSGSARETMWANLLREVLPQKFSLVQNVILIDSEGKASHEVDVAAIDEQYTPYVFQSGDIKFVPIEAVALVMECKSSSVNQNSLKEWSESIGALSPSRYGIARMVQGYCIGLTNKTQTATRPIRVYAAFQGAYGLSSTELDGFFDIFLHVGSDGLKLKIPHERNSLAWWANALNMAGRGDKPIDEPMTITPPPLQDDCGTGSPVRWEKRNESTMNTCASTLEDLKVDGNDLLTLNLQLNQLLMLMNNPMLFPHFAYAKVFRERLTKKSPA